MPERATPSNWHCRRTDRPEWLRSTSARRSGALIFRTSWLKIPFHNQLTDLGVQLLHLALVPGHAIAAAVLERPRRLLQKLLLPGVNLVGMDLIALGQIGHGRLLPQRLQGDLRLQHRVNL